MSSIPTNHRACHDLDGIIENIDPSTASRLSPSRMLQFVSIGVDTVHEKNLNSSLLNDRQAHAMRQHSSARDSIWNVADNLRQNALISDLSHLQNLGGGMGNVNSANHDMILQLLGHQHDKTLMLPQGVARLPLPRQDLSRTALSASLGNAPVGMNNHQRFTNSSLNSSLNSLTAHASQLMAPNRNTVGSSQHDLLLLRQQYLLAGVNSTHQLNTASTLPSDTLYRQNFPNDPVDVNRDLMMLKHQFQQTGVNQNLQMFPESMQNSERDFVDMLASRKDPGWEEQFKALCEYRSDFGHSQVPARYKRNPRLG